VSELSRQLAAIWKGGLDEDSDPHHSLAEGLSLFVDEYEPPKVELKLVKEA